ncbi:DNA cytosine methyltransferase [Alistipes ihumii]|jgi:DNA (cytosine-5-)-methyltransferase|uniref:DNA cytosine methyltransferase n=1 Tax=Alistipes ihumii TaxID=1470347 RepID=UPI003AB33136
MSLQKNIGVIDLFCGVGGLSYGLKRQGLNIIAGFDIDKTCRFAYEHNNDAKFFDTDIKRVTGEEIRTLFGDSKIKVLAGCAPCQPFSSYAFSNKDKDPNKYDLLYQFGRLIDEVRPDIVTMENVTQIAQFKLKPVLVDFVKLLKDDLHYHVSVNTVYCPNYGIPQTRKRLVLLASRIGDIKLIPPTHAPENYVKVEDVIGDLPKLKAGEQCADDPLHKATALSELNLRRIRNTPYGGSWKDWPEELKLKCHKSKTGKSFGSVYGRMVWERPAPTMTTQCTGLGNGRFGHPTQDRAISVREAALIQTFPKTYKFFADEETVSITKASRYIGNAVPPKLGEVIAKSIIDHLTESNKA